MYIDRERESERERYTVVDMLSSLSITVVLYSLFYCFDPLHVATVSDFYGRTHRSHSSAADKWGQH